MEQNLILRYTLHEDGAHLVQALGESPCLELPDTLGGRPVTQIGAYAFAQNPAKIRPEGPLLTEALGSPAGAGPLCRFACPGRCASCKAPAFSIAGA